MPLVSYSQLNVQQKRFLVGILSSLCENRPLSDDATPQTGGEILRQSFQFAGTCHPRLRRRGLGKGKLFERVPSLHSPYQRPATASWWLSVPVLWAAAKSRRLAPRLANNSLLAQHMFRCQSTNLTVPYGHLHMSILALFVFQVCCLE